MKPKQLKIKAFGPYLHEQIIDFDKVGKDGLFLICGETGAGKTVLLDAIVYALYGKSSGGLRQNIECMRCQNADINDNTLIEFIFSKGESLYKFTRGISFNKARNGEIKQNTTQMCYKFDGENFIPLLENGGIRNVVDKANEIIGLNYEQFTRVIMLPQGQFEKLLIADSGEKENLLITLFNTKMYDRICERMNIKVRAESTKLKEIENQIKGKLSVYNCENIEELTLLINQSGEQLEKLTNEQKVVDIQYKALEKTMEINNRLLATFEKLDAELKTKTKLEKSSNSIETLSKDMEKCQIILNNKLAYTNYKKAEENKANEQKSYDKTVADIQKNNKELQALATEKEYIENTAEEVRQLEVEVTKMTNNLPLYSQFEQCLKDKNSLAQQEKTIKNKYESNGNKQTSINEKIEQSKSKLLEEKSELNRLATEYFDNIASTLAESLIDGEPCPVCGSRNHVNKNIVNSSQAISREIIDTKSADIDVLSNQIEKLTAEANSYQDIANQLNIDIINCQNEQKNVDNNIAMLQNQLGNDNISKEQCERKIGENNKHIRTYSDRKSQYETRAKELENQSITLEATRELQEKVLNNSIIIVSQDKKALDEILTTNSLVLADFKNNIDSETIKSNLNKIKTHHDEVLINKTQIEALKSEIGDSERPVIDKLLIELEELKFNNEQLLSQIAKTDSKIADYKKIYSDIEIQQKDHSARKDKNDKLKKFMERTRGDTGMGLNRYVLGVMLDIVISEANKSLAQVLGGRYILKRTLEKQGSAQKSGLDLIVLDKNSGFERAVTTLSGGEKFIVSLSLSLALTKVVQMQSGGNSLDAMFIDEGFGTLDENSIIDALQVLMNAQNSNSMVGIISHVGKLKESIQSKINVIKSNKESIIECV